ADDMVKGVGDVEVAAGVHRHAIGVVEFGGGGGAVVAAVARGAVARDGGDHPCAGVHLADAVVLGVGDEDVAAGVHRHAIGVVEFGGGGGAVVAAVACGAVAGDGGD